MDITAQKQAETTLQNREATYRSAFEKSGAASIIIEEDMTISLANPKYEQLTGYTRAEIEGRMKWTAFISKEDLERMKGYHVERRKGPGRVPDEYECKLINRKGEKIDVWISVGMLPGPNRSIASFIDITSRKRAEQALRDSETRLSAIIDALDGYIYTCTREFRIEFMNKALIDYIGQDKTGGLCHRDIFGLDQACQWCGNEAVFKGETVRQEIKNPADGRWFYILSSPMFDTDGSVTRMQATIIDITKQKQTEETLIKRKEYLQKENLLLKSSMKERYKFMNIIGKSTAMQGVYDQIINAAATDAGVILYGESGTGKELAARAIHDLSDRKHGPFVVVHCGAIAENLIESEFFGHRKGAFTGADRDKQGYLDLADGGTLFLDELGELGRNMQVKLLRAIEGGGYTPVGSAKEKKSDIRIVAATNRNLQEQVKTGLMREDFFYRIHIIPITLPPLRDRKEDLPLLVEHFMKMYGETERLPPITGKILDAIQQYDWPGNVRELQNTLHRYVTLKQFGMLQPSAADGDEPEILAESPPRKIGNIRNVIRDFEKNYILSALERYQWHRGKAASALGIDRRTLFKKTKQYGIENTQIENE
ncbi:MAG: sigma 54-interacting transcriptional regulator [Desulfobacterales bacterium]|jgi:PAS domain S-box-containing protein|nr:sigma 54-interacting transcriptional regulator [Desulfobacterales bacterium]